MKLFYTEDFIPIYGEGRNHFWGASMTSDWALFVSFIFVFFYPVHFYAGKFPGTEELIVFLENFYGTITEDKHQITLFLNREQGSIEHMGKSEHIFQIFEKFRTKELRLGVSDHLML